MELIVTSFLAIVLGFSGHALLVITQRLLRWKRARLASVEGTLVPPPGRHLALPCLAGRVEGAQAPAVG
jgi:hypothetical protein